MIATLIKQPHIVSFTGKGNPIPFTFALSPYGPTEREQDIRLQIRVLVEQVFNSNIFTEVKNQNFYPTADGLVSMEVQSILDPYLSFYTPRPLPTQPVLAAEQRKRFKISWLLSQNGAIIGTLGESQPFFAIKGGLAYEAWHPKDFFQKNIIEGQQPLHFPATGEKRHKLGYYYFFWIYPFADNAIQTITTKAYMADGTVLTKTATISGSQWGVFCTSARLALFTSIDKDDSPLKYSITVRVGLTVIVKEFFFEIDNRVFYDPVYLVYRNSLGGLDTVRLTGQVELEAEYNRQTAVRSLPPTWYANLNLLPQESDEAAEEQITFTGDTGFISKAACDKLRDLFLSQQVMLVRGTNFIPVNIVAKKAKFYTNKDSLISTTIEYQYAFANNYYTPEGYRISSTACPAVETLVVKQISKNKLQIMYALQSPYDVIEVQIIEGSTTKTYTYYGNTRTLIQVFAISSAPPPTSITVKARTVCDENSYPVDYGPFTTVEVPIIGNSLPVANDDFYNIASGYNSAITLAPSALANDYDPDGDAIEAVSNSGSTAKGGTFTINSAGIVQYTPPNSGFTGNDSFSYSIREVGGSTTVSAVVNIKVGDGASGVFAKLVTRNYIYSNAANYSHSEGEIWVDFFSNPAGTIPIDVTGMGLTINVQDTYKEKALGDDETVDTIDYPTTGTSTKVLVYSGELSDWFMEAGGSGDEAYRNHEFKILPGTGYVVI